MAYDEILGNRIHEVLKKRKNFTEKKMFGGLAFLYRGHMCCGIVKNQLVVRVGPQHDKKALAKPHARPMDFTGRPLKGFVFVQPQGYRTSKSLENWVKSGIKFVQTLSPK